MSFIDKDPCIFYKLINYIIFKSKLYNYNKHSFYKHNLHTVYFYFDGNNSCNIRLFLICEKCSINTEVWIKGYKDGKYDLVYDDRRVDIECSESNQYIKSIFNSNNTDISFFDNFGEDLNTIALGVASRGFSREIKDHNFKLYCYAFTIHHRNNYFMNRFDLKCLDCSVRISLSVNGWKVFSKMKSNMINSYYTYNNKSKFFDNKDNLAEFRQTKCKDFIIKNIID